MDIYANALQQGFRYPTSKGEMSTEDLFSLSLTSLDAIYRTLSRSIKREQEESLLNRETAADRTTRQKMDVVKAVVELKQEQNKEKAEKAQKKAQKAFYREALEKKRLEKIGNMSEAELEAALKDVD